MATIEEKQLAKEILLELLRKDALLFDEFPDFKGGYVGLTIHAYQEILKSISESA